MNEVFIWLSGLRFIDKNKLLMARNFFKTFTENKLWRELVKTVIWKSGTQYMMYITYMYVCTICWPVHVHVYTLVQWTTFEI